MNGSNFQIEQQCPQCGAPIILDEADRILACQFCRTRVFLSSEDHFRFYIPPVKGIAEPIYHIPYWRLKGLSYAIQDHDVSSKYFDANFLSFDSPLLPYSLGLRPQAMKLKFVGSSENEGKFIASSFKTKENLLKKYKNRVDAVREIFIGENVHQEIFIGETVSIIYTPVYCSHNRIYDAVLKKPLDLQAKDLEVEKSLISAPDEKWHVEFLSLLCPACGADLPGEKDAFILFCKNCNSAWNPSKKNFVKTKILTWEEKGDDITYLPFWQLKVNINGLQLETYADLIRVANLPKVPSDIWQQTPFYFYAPAFKLNPALFLRWCRQLTATPAAKDLTDYIPAGKIHHATLPVTEALESAIITLSSLMADKRQLAQIMAPLKFTLEDSCLVLHPFRTGIRELVHTKLGFSMDLGALTMGAYL